MSFSQLFTKDCAFQGNALTDIKKLEAITKMKRLIIWDLLCLKHNGWKNNSRGRIAGTLHSVYSIPQEYPFILVLSGEHDKTLLFLIVWHEHKYSQASNLRGGKERDADHPSSAEPPGSNETISLCQLPVTRKKGVRIPHTHCLLNGSILAQACGQCQT